MHANKLFLYLVLFWSLLLQQIFMHDSPDVFTLPANLLPDEIREQVDYS